MLKTLLRTLFVAAAVASLAGAAFAHPDMVRAVPAANAQVASPTELRLVFSEPLFVKFSGVVVKDAHGRTVKTGKPGLAPGDDKVMVVPLGKPLAAGTYTVQWRAVSADTHRITGSYSFTVR